MRQHDLLVETAKSYIGIHEEGAANHGAQVEEFQKAVDGKAQGEPWCMAFVQFCVKKASKQDVLFDSEHCMTAWFKSPICARYDATETKVAPGFIAIWRHEGTSNGHTGIVVSVTKDEILTVEGNTSGGPGVEREGDGVYLRPRSRSGSGKMRLIGFIDPFYGCPNDEAI